MFAIQRTLWFTSLHWEREKVELPLFIHPSDEMNHLARARKVILLSNIPRQKAEKQENRRIEIHSSEICTTFVCLSAFPPLPFLLLCSFFNFSCSKKRLQWIEREKNLLIFGSMLFYRSTSIHLSQYSAWICSRVKYK